MSVIYCAIIWTIWSITLCPQMCYSRTFNTVVSWTNIAQFNTSGLSVGQDLHLPHSYFNLYQTPKYAKERVCQSVGNPNNLMGRSIDQLRQQFGDGCVFIQGDLVISGTRNNDSLTFLSTIREVSGSVIIVNNRRTEIPLDNLEIIRGENYLLMNGLPFSLTILRNRLTNPKRVFVKWPKLRSIMRHNVLIYNNTGLCSLAFGPNWDDILEDVTSQMVIAKNADKFNCSERNVAETSMNCNASCRSYLLNEGNNYSRSFCWGPNKKDCQTMNKCQGKHNEHCSRCYTQPLNGKQIEMCCHEECVAGCSGATNTQCRACKNYHEENKCVAHCPPKYVITATRETNLNPNFRVKDGALCSKQCPKDFYLDEDSCVRFCDRPQTQLLGNQCVPCGDNCRRKCSFKHLEPLNSTSARSLANCNILDGSIKIVPDSFHSDDPLTWESLQSLSSLHEISGYLHVAVTTLAPWLKNLTFLGNLQTIRAEPSRTEPTHRMSALWIVENSHLEFLGLRNLKTIDKGIMLIKDNPRLCYTDQLQYIQLDINGSLLIGNNSDPAICKENGLECHEACEGGCYGPGPGMCFACKLFYHAGNRLSERLCTLNCSSVAGYFSPPVRTNGTSQSCISCHEECDSSNDSVPTCRGPNSNQCFAPCKHVKDGDTCKGKCSLNQYLFSNSTAARLGECRSCHVACGLGKLKYPSISSHPVFCSGPSNTISTNGCTWCKFIQVRMMRNSTEHDIFCISKPLSPLPGYFSMKVRLTSQPHLDLLSDVKSRLDKMTWIHDTFSITSHLNDTLQFIIQTMSRVTNPSAIVDDVEIFLPCHPLCGMCHDEGRMNCDTCNGWRYLDECVARCPPMSFREKLLSAHLNRTRASNERYCLPCHEYCRDGCDGPGEFNCFACKHVEIPVGNASHFYCNITCPPSLPYPRLKPQGVGLVCQSTAAITNEIFWWTVISAFTFFLLLLFIGWGMWFYHKKWKTFLSIHIFKDNERSSSVGSGPSQISHMLVIPESQLQRGETIGSGAFGTVYRGKWFPDLSQITSSDMDEVDDKFPMDSSSPNEHELQTLQSEPHSPTDHECPSCLNGMDYRPRSLISQTSEYSNSLGNFVSSTYKRKLNRRFVRVAIKVLSDTSSPIVYKELLEEAKVMASVSHPYCLRVLALCMTAEPQLITQYMPLGNLLNYVRTKKGHLTSRGLLLWAKQIACGMHYLESRGVIHRDLAARNVLVESVQQIKITDFGLAKHLENDENFYQARGGRLPVRWMAVESLTKHKFSHKSDVWSYGVTLWEMFTYGLRPYGNVLATDILATLERGERLPQPNICSLDMYTLMVHCWLSDAESRPTFDELESKLARMQNNPGHYLHVGMSVSGTFLRPSIPPASLREVDDESYVPTVSDRVPDQYSPFTDKCDTRSASQANIEEMRLILQLSEGPFRCQLSPVADDSDGEDEEGYQLPLFQQSPCTPNHCPSKFSHPTCLVSSPSDASSAETGSGTCLLHPNNNRFHLVGSCNAGRNKPPVLPNRRRVHKFMNNS